MTGTNSIGLDLDNLTVDLARTTKMESDRILVRTPTPNGEKKGRTQPEGGNV
jgi:hypothetical protein